MIRKNCFIAAGIAIILSLVLAAGPTGAAETKTAHSAEVVSSMLKAYGGADALKKVVSVTAQGRITEFVSGKAGSYLRYFERPGKLRVEVMPEQGGETRILNRNRGWRLSNGAVADVSPLELQSLLYQYSYLNLPFALASGSYHPEYLHLDGAPKEKEFLLLVGPKDSPRLAILVDAKSGLITRVDASFGLGAVGTAELSTEFADYRPVAGVQFPHKLTSYAGGIVLSEIVLDSILVNQKIPPELFTPQEGKPPQQTK
jgi:hypothetical protein